MLFQAFNCLFVCLVSLGTRSPLSLPVCLFVYCSGYTQPPVLISFIICAFGCTYRFVYLCATRVHTAPLVLCLGLHLAWDPAVQVPAVTLVRWVERLIKKCCSRFVQGIAIPSINLWAFNSLSASPLFLNLNFTPVGGVASGSRDLKSWVKAAPLF